MIGLKNLSTLLKVLKNSIFIGSRKTLNLIEGTNTSLTVEDNQAQNRVDVTITGTGPGGDMTKAVYDIDNDGRVDKAESVDDGVNVSSAINVKSAVDLKHTQGTDQGLDTGGANQVTVADAKDAITKRHTQNTDTDLNPAHKDASTGVHGVGISTVESISGSQAKVNAHKDLTTGVHGVGVGTIAKVGDIAIDANLSAAGQDAISKKHTQGTDTALGAVGTKNPAIDADKVIYRDSISSDVLVTSTWTQIKAFLKTYWDTLYEAIGAVATHAGAADPHTGYQKESEKDAISGYAGLDGSSKVIKDPANATATPTALKIPIADASGKLDSWITALPKFSAHKNGAYQTVSTATWTKITFTTEEYDVGSGYDAVNSKWIPALIGKGHIDAKIYIGSPPDQSWLRIFIYKNNAIYKGNDIRASGANDQVVNVNIDINVDVVTDYFEIYIYHNCGVDKPAGGESWDSYFMGHMLL